MSDFLDTDLLSTDIVGTIKNTVFQEPSLEQYNAGQRVFGAAGAGGLTAMNLPKMKFSYVLEIVLSPFAKNFIQTQLIDTHSAFDVYNVCCFVREADLPSSTFELETLNQYNRKRISTGRVTYEPVNISFYDTADSSVLLLLDAYKKYYYGEYFDKDPQNFGNDVYSSPNNFEGTASNWGRSLMNHGDFDNQYFFEAINLYEIDGSRYTAHNMYNVFLENISMDRKSHDSAGEPSVINLTAHYEGTGNYGPDGYASIAAPTMEIANILTSADMFGKSGFYKLYGELDDKTQGILSIGKVIRAGAAGADILNGIEDILRGNMTPDTIRNIGAAVSTGSDAIGLGSIVNNASSKFGLGNIMGDF